jgi:CBS domain-containing protein
MLIETILNEKGGAVITVPAEATLQEAARLLDDRRIGAAVAVTAQGALAGVLSERDVLRAVARQGAGGLETRVADAMTRAVITIGLKETLDAGLSRMTDRRIRHLPVVDEAGRLVGLVSIGDLVKWKIAETALEAESLRSYVAG